LRRLKKVFKFAFEGFFYDNEQMIFRIDLICAFIAMIFAALLNLIGQNGGVLFAVIGLVISAEG
jgi:diacylglycerol kinase